MHQDFIVYIVWWKFPSFFLGEYGWKLWDTVALKNAPCIFYCVDAQFEMQSANDLDEQDQQQSRERLSIRIRNFFLSGPISMTGSEARDRKAVQSAILLTVPRLGQWAHLSCMAENRHCKCRFWHCSVEIGRTTIFCCGARSRLLRSPNDTLCSIQVRNKCNTNNGIMFTDFIWTASKACRYFRAMRLLMQKKVDPDRIGTAVMSVLSIGAVVYVMAVLITQTPHWVVTCSPGGRHSSPWLPKARSVV